MVVSYEVHGGPMFARKTEAIIGRLGDAVVAEQKILVVRPAVDNREDRNIFTKISERADLSNYSNLKMISISSLTEFQEAVRLFEPQVIAIDEAQFFGMWIVDYLQEILDNHKLDDEFVLLVAGLDMDSNRQPFGPMPQLFAKAYKPIKHKAICNKCKKKNAVYTYRKGSSLPQIVIGNKETYEARCPKCFDE